MSQFLDADKEDDSLTHLMFIDADIGFRGEAVRRVLESGYDIACGIYPRKNIEWDKIPDLIKTSDKNLEQRALGYNLNFADPNIKFCRS